MMNFATMTPEELASVAIDPDANPVPQHTVVMPGRSLAPQDAKPVPQRIVVKPTLKAPPPPGVEAPRKGRAKFMDPTNPEQIQGIAQRCVRHYLHNNGLFVPLPKNRAIAHAKALKSQGGRVAAQLEKHSDGEVLTFLSA